MDIIRAMRLLVPPAGRTTRIWTRNCVPSLTLTPAYGAVGWPGGHRDVRWSLRCCNLDRNGLRPARYVITKDKPSPAPLKSVSGIISLTKWSKRPRRARRTDGDRHPQWAYSASAETDDDLKSRHPYKEWMEKTSADWYRLKICPMKKWVAATGRRHACQLPETV